MFAAVPAQSGHIKQSPVSEMSPDRALALIADTPALNAECFHLPLPETKLCRLLVLYAELRVVSAAIISYELY